MRILPCKICLKKASMHMSLYHRNLNLIRCNYYRCNSYFRSSVENLKHQELVHVAGERQIKCIFCGILVLIQSMRRHFKNKLKSQLKNAFKCTFHCVRYFLTKEELDEHVGSFLKRASVCETGVKVHLLQNTVPRQTSAAWSHCPLPPRH